MSTNDNAPALLGPPPMPNEAYGRAALLLVESLIHGLCEHAVIGPASAVEIVERAISVQGDQAEEADAASDAKWRSYALLSSIAASLRIDAPTAPAQPGHGS